MPQVTNAPVLDRAEPDSRWVAEFERALRARPDVDLRAFLPATNARAFVPTLVELVRIDIERRWERGTPKRVEEYLEEYPELLGTDSLAALAFEEYRGRVRANQPLTPDVKTDLLATMRQSVQPLARGGARLGEWVESLRGRADQAVNDLRTADPASVAVAPSIRSCRSRLAWSRRRRSRCARTRRWLARRGRVRFRSPALPKRSWST